METIQVVREIAQIIYYVALSVAGPLAVIAYLSTRQTDRHEKEYKTYDEPDNKLFEYQKLALQYYDLDILEIPNNDPSLAFDKKRKQEQVAFAILFSLFERAFLMFNHQTATFKKKQWSGWKRFLDDFLRRESIRAAWECSKQTYDTDFQAFMAGKIAALPPQPTVSAKSTNQKGTWLFTPSSETAEIVPGVSRTPAAAEPKVSVV